MIDTHSGTARFLDFVSDVTLPVATLLELTGERKKARPGWWPSGLQKGIAEAWVRPMTDLTCGQCRMLVGQKFGLPWLARPVATFVVRYPQAECDLYPGDLTVNALIAWRELAQHSPKETANMLALDFEWLRQEAREDEWEGSILKQAVASLDEALHV